MAYRIGRYLLGWRRSRCGDRLAVVLGLAILIMLSPQNLSFAKDVNLLGNDLKRGYCKVSDTFVLVLHGGTARRPSNHKSGMAFIARLLKQAQPALQEGARSLDLVHRAVRAMEDSSLFNAGRGARANQAGVVEMDAAIMDGKRQFAGAVASVKTVKNPISAALMVMQQSTQVLRVGPDAEAFVAKNNGTIVKPSYFRLSGLNFSDVPYPKKVKITPPDPALGVKLAGFAGIWGGVMDGAMTVLLTVEKITEKGAKVLLAHGIAPGWNIAKGSAKRYDAKLEKGRLWIDLKKPWDGRIGLELKAENQLSMVYNVYNAGRRTISLRRFKKLPKAGKHGTVGAVALDRCGNLAAATSTGGFGSKVPGRVGDSPIIGAGTYANNNSAAISATGHGEFFMRFVIAHDIAARMEYGGISLEEAAQKTINGKLSEADGKGGIIAVDAKGNVAMVFNTEGMLRGVVSFGKKPKVAVY